MAKKFKLKEEKALLPDEKTRANIDWTGEEVEAKSETTFDDDKGTGDVILIRNFDYKANPIAFKDRVPTKQELFNHHHKQIEVMLWADGLVPMTDLDPRVIISKKKDGYRIFVACKPARGQLLSTLNTPKKLAELSHDASRNL